ncbi:hypothetical protein [Hydrogenophaga sp.]|uniref:hypothetical protein n=1 Tax=Hydrogenophaga sp. TaxID=1904254 RepID=UPI00286E8956|nr:hypothetical protein [Hydrogenophaga sp.]
MQGHLAEFIVVAGERHKQLRIALDAHRTKESRQTKKDLGIAYKAVSTHLDHHLGRACQAVFTALNQYFDDRHHAYLHRPRFCIKLRRGENVYTYARDGAVSVDRSEKAFQAARDDNTGFDWVATQGSPFFENDLPTLAKAARYKNPRLNVARATSYSSSWLAPLLDRLSAKPVDDDRWIDCWEADRPAVRPSAVACYKSTLIVPMTLLHHQVSAEFKEYFGLHGHLLPAESEKYNFGFLCVDSHHKDFFNDQDRANLFMHADLFCLFLISAYTFREHSQTFADAEKIVKSVGNSSTTSRAQPRGRRA